MNYKYKRMFFRFLKERHIIFRSEANYINFKRSMYDYTPYKRFINKTDVFRAISNAFGWKETKEGFDFWMFIHSEWYETIRTHKTNK